MTTPYTQPNNLPESDLELLSAYIDNQLTIAERTALDKRLAAEPLLRSELDELRATRRVLRDLPALPPPRSFTLDPATVKQTRSFFPWRWALQLGGGLAGLALVALFSLQFFLSGGGGAAYQAAPASEQMAMAAPTTAPAPQPTAAAAAGAPEAGSAPMAEAPAAAATEAPAPTAAPAATEAPAAAAMAAPEATGASEAADAPEAAAEPEQSESADTAARQTTTGAAGLANAPTDIIGNTGLSSPDTSQLYPAPPPNDRVNARTDPEPGFLNPTWLIGGGIGLLALLALVVLLVRGRGM
jgi:hypothetical protein